MDIGIRDGSLYQAGYRSAIEGLRTLGLSVVELQIDRDGSMQSLTTGERVALQTDADREQFAAACRAARVRVCALLCTQDFNAPDLAVEIDYVAMAARAAVALGAGTVRLDSIMTGQRELPLAERIRIFAAGCHAALEASADTGVALGIENHGHQGNDPAWMDGVLKAVPNPRLGLTLDVGNWYWYGHPLSRVYEIYHRYGARAKHTHVKNIAYPAELREVQREVGYKYEEYCAPLPDGDIDMARVVRILRGCGYDSVLCVEDESLGKVPQKDRPAVLARDIACLRAVF
ncbi:MAG: sugar phosphate isomerase/epimerase [Armatimonadetes bacterium]|nr:sugar phosphate isomerase/epimerase [Armatimonadota bacterium]